MLTMLSVIFVMLAATSYLLEREVAFINESNYQLMQLSIWAFFLVG